MILYFDTYTNQKRHARQTESKSLVGVIFLFILKIFVVKIRVIRELNRRAASLFRMPLGATILGSNFGRSGRKEAICVGPSI